MRRGAFDARGKRQERLSEYFDFTGPDGKEKALLPVKRFEFQAFLVQLEKARLARRFFPRLWRWLRGSGSWAECGLPTPTAREIARGERTPVPGQPVPEDARDG